MVRVIFIRHNTPLASNQVIWHLRLFFFSVAKDSGKVLVIIIYCFYNYYCPHYPGIYRHILAYVLLLLLLLLLLFSFSHQQSNNFNIKYNALFSKSCFGIK